MKKSTHLLVGVSVLFIVQMQALNTWRKRRRTPSKARAARTHRSRVRHTRWTPPSVPNQLEWVGSTPRSLWGCSKLAAERATDGVLAEVVECET